MNKFSKLFAVALLVSSFAAFGMDDKDGSGQPLDGNNTGALPEQGQGAGKEDKSKAKPNFAEKAKAFGKATKKGLKAWFITGKMKNEQGLSVDIRQAFDTTAVMPKSLRAKIVAKFFLPKAGVVAVVATATGLVVYLIKKKKANQAAVEADEFDDEEEAEETEGDAAVAA